MEVDTSKKIKKRPVDEPPLYIVAPSVSVPLPSVPTPSVVARSASSSSSFERPELFNERDTVPTTEAEEEEVPSPKLKLSSISQNCPYRQLCERFLNTLNLQGNHQCIQYVAVFFTYFNSLRFKMNSFFKNHGDNIKCLK